ncbi:MAG: Gfo/Idh/MocA family oxidoreductase [Acidobacteria bacterium]|nr:Gfo/Idh/MocA family oxidoreductase [Acidobacteriota bacterium]
MTTISRRGFLKTAAASGVMIVPRRVLGGPGHVPPSDRLNVAGIGVGGQGGGDMAQMEKENIVALCDADWQRAARTFAKHPTVPKYKDFRVMFDKQKDIDAVVVATPDHVHAVAALAAIDLGKHVFVEKPLAHNVWETRRLVKAAREAKVATQMGNQGHAMESIRVLCEWIWDGAIGPVTEVHAWTPHPVWPQGMLARPAERPPVPDTLDWDVWLGPAAARPYHPAYLPASWRGWLDFGTGGLGDMGCHIFDHIAWALKLGAPISVEASASTFVGEAMNWDKPKNNETYPQATLVAYRFPAREGFPPLTLTWYDGGLMPARPEELPADARMGDTYGGALYVGEKGKILTGSHGANGLRILPEKRMQRYTRPPKTLPRSIGHHQEWIAACKGGPPAGSNFEFAGPLTEIVLLGCAAIRSGEKLYWDAANMRFPNCPEADQYLTRKYRAGWEVV